MCNILKISKNDLIKKIFKDNVTMQEIVERAYNGEGSCQELLADWLEENNHFDDARIWRDKAKTYYKQIED